MPCIELDGQLPTGLRAYETYQVYNCLDSCLTAQLAPAMLAQANENHLRTYDREMRLQALCLEMSTKGFPVSQLRAVELLHELRKEADRALYCLDKFTEAVYAPRLNPNSPVAVASFFYDFMAFPVIWKYDYKTKQRKRGADRDSLEKLRAMHPSAVPFINAILAYREAVKLAGVFKKGLEPSGVLRCNFSPSGTETGRLSSQRNVYGRGTNAQNLNDRVRQVVEAPAGFVLGYFDLKTAESIAVGYLSGDQRYIDACMGGDLHTAVAALTWPSLGWAGDLKRDRQLADQIFYRDFSYRDMAKRGGHGTNYLGTPRTMAMHLKVMVQLIEQFQEGYFSAFPGIPAWHLETIARVQQEGRLITPLGRERQFWGRGNDPATHRKAVAFVPQSLVADTMNEGLMQVQRWLRANCKEVDNVPVRWCDGSVRYARDGLLAQVHDAGLFLLPLDGVHEISKHILREIVFPVDFGSLGTMRIPADCQLGKRWSKRKEKPGLLDGLRDWQPGEGLEFVTSA